jgi:hypothetical protein
MITNFTNGFKTLFDWVGNLGTFLKDSLIALLPERMRKWIQEDEKASSEKELSPNNVMSNKVSNVPQQTQALIMNPKSVTFQPHDKDQLYKMEESSVFAKPDDILGKTFQSIDKQFKALNTLTQTTNDKLADTIKIFSELLKVNQQQLNILPALIPQPAVSSPSFPSTTYDGISDARHEARRQIWG